MRTDNRKTIPR